MKKVFTFLVAVLLTATVWAQSPEKMSYQAVIRNSSDVLVTNTQIGMQISILQGSTSGTAVYVERHFPTTNANGLVSIEIGAGTVVSGDFTTINWANGTYFVKTETDLNGGANYTITGTSQLLSVPYALHAKSAETVTGGITETDPLFTSSQAANITATDITNLGNLSGTNTGDQDISGIATNKQAIQDTAVQIRADIPTDNNQLANGAGYMTSYTESDPVYRFSVARSITLTDITNWNNKQEQLTAGRGIDITGNVITTTTYSVGDFAQGGIVFWVDETGQHGLVCAKKDQSTGIRWYAGTDGYTHAKGDGPFAGEANTSLIIATQVAIGDDGATYAARICNELQVTEGGKIYGDWYLPSKEELDLMYQNKATIDATAGAHGGSSFASAYYWGSTEYGKASAWDQSFGSGTQHFNYTKSWTYRVRAVRAF